MHFDEATGKPLQEEWHQNGVRHRVGGPALTVFDPATGIAIHEVWAEKGQLHRLEAEGPAVIHRAINGVVTKEMYIHRGELHREHGAAEIYRDAETGKIRPPSAYYIHGERVFPYARKRTIEGP